MKVVFILLDSLVRTSLEAYGGSMIATPNFNRLVECGVTFDTHYAGSMPCIPARRDLFTGRLNFLHRSWGPIEPFDQCFPEILSSNGIYTHLITDHYHYWEDGGCGYHNRYRSSELIRGQERDLWKAMVAPPVKRFRHQYHKMLSESPRRFPNMVNREFIRNEQDFPIVHCIQKAMEFLSINHSTDNWFLQIELFNPHEPFHIPKRFREFLPTEYHGPILDWPRYDQLNLSNDEACELRANYAAAVAMCDYYIGQLWNELDRYHLWEDTVVILTTDHGFLLGEHGWWGKNRMPFYDPIVHIPLIVWHPDYKSHAGLRRTALTQTIDLMPTFLELFGVSPPREVEGRSLFSVMERNETIRQAALYGIFGGSVNITDGKYTYFRYPQDCENAMLYEYTLMPVHPATYFTPAEFEGATLTRQFSFTRGMPVLKLPAIPNGNRPPMQGGAFADPNTVLYDLEKDMEQNQPLHAPEVEIQLVTAMVALMRENEAPEEQFRRLDLPFEKETTL